MKSFILAAFAAMPSLATAADKIVNTNQSNIAVTTNSTGTGIGDLLILRTGDTGSISSGVSISSSSSIGTNPKRGGYITILNGDNSLVIGDNVSLNTITSNTSGGAIKALNGFTAGNGFSITNSSGTIGGAIYERISGTASETDIPSNPNIIIGNNSNFSNNTSTSGLGGAIAVEYGNLIIGSGATFSGNTASAGAGGAIVVYADPTNYIGTSPISQSSSVSIGNGATFSGNTAAQGGAIANYATGAFVNAISIGAGTSFQNNTALANDGSGAIMNQGIMTLNTTASSGITFGATDGILLSGASSQTKVLGGGAITSQSDMSVASGAALDIGTSALSFAGSVGFTADSSLTVGIAGANNYGTISAGSFDIASGASLNAIVSQGAIASGQSVSFNFLRNTDGTAIGNNNFSPISFNNALYGFTYDPSTGLYSATRTQSAGGLARSLGAPVYMGLAADAWEGGQKGLRANLVATRLNLLAQSNATDYVQALESLTHNNTRIRQYDLLEQANLMFLPQEGAPSGSGTLCKSKDMFCERDRSGNAIWFDISYGQAHDKDDFLGFKENNSAVSAGVEHNFSKSVLGLALSYATAEQDYDQAEANLEKTGVLLYGRRNFDAAFANIGLAYGNSATNEYKYVNKIPVYADFKDSSRMAQFGGGYVFDSAMISFAPEVKFRYASSDYEAYKDEAGQEFSEWRRDIFSGELGFAIKGGASMLTDYGFLPEFSASAVRDLYSGGDGEVSVVLSGGEDYKMPVEDTPKTGYDVGVGIALFSNYAEPKLSYRAEFRDGYTSHTGSVNIKGAF